MGAYQDTVKEVGTNQVKVGSIMEGSFLLPGKWVRNLIS